MKFNNSQLEAFYTKPNPQIKAFLVFGQDEGAIREIFFKVAQMIVPDLTDAFRVAELTPLNLKGNASALYDEAAAISLMGGRRLVKVDGADESVVEPLSLFLDKYDGDSFVVLSAGNLTKASKLRKLAESSEKMAAYAAYADDKEALRSIIAADIKKAGKTADFATVSWLADNLGADRGLTRSEIQKLITFAGNEENITAEMAQSIVGDGSAASMDDLVYALADGNFAALDKVMARIFAEDDNAAVAIVRAAMYHFQRLHLTVARIANGASYFEAAKYLYPPVHFKKEDAFRAQLRLWNSAKIERVLRHLIDTEIECKASGNVPKTVCSAALLNICRLAKK